VLNLTSHSCQQDCNGVSNMVEYAPTAYYGLCRAPFTCDNEVASDGLHGKCKCSAAIGKKTCRTCDWVLRNVGGAMTTVNTCTICQGGRYLWLNNTDPGNPIGTCLSNCPAGYTSVTDHVCMNHFILFLCPEYI
jgi:hypothetical protein